MSRHSSGSCGTLASMAAETSMPTVIPGRLGRVASARSTAPVPAPAAPCRAWAGRGRAPHPPFGARATAGDRRLRSARPRRSRAERCRPRRQRVCPPRRRPRPSLGPLERENGGTGAHSRATVLVGVVLACLITAATAVARRHCKHQASGLQALGGPTATVRAPTTAGTGNPASSPRVVALTQRRRRARL